MKECPECGYENLNEMFYCRHCNYEFPDFDWDSVEHENLMFTPSMYETRCIERKKFFKNMENSFIKQLLILLLEGIICYPILNYGFFHNWFVYVLFVLIFYLIIMFTYQFSFIFKLFRIKTTVMIKGIEFYNLRIQGFMLLCSGIIMPIICYPTIFYERYIIVFYFASWGSLIPFVIGLSYFLKPNTFNEYNAYAIFGTELMMFLMGGNLLFLMFYHAAYKHFPLFVNVILISLYMALISSLFFPDVINKYNKHDIRGKKSAYVIYLLVGFLALFFLELIMAELLGLLFS